MPLAHLALLALLAAPATQPAQPMRVPPQAVEALMKAIYQDRERAETWLRTDSQSYLAAVQREEFAGRTSLTIGRAPDSDLRIDDPLILPHHVRITVAGDSFHVVTLDDSARFRVGGEAEPRDTTLAPTSIMLGKAGALWGRYNVRLSHQNYPALILFDGMSQRFKEYRGLKHFPADLSYRYLLPMSPDPKMPDTLMIGSTRGKGRPAQRLGWFDFMVGKKRCRLTAIHLLEPGIDSSDVAVFFRDQTNGKETSGMGRYLQVHGVPGTKKYLLDFNRAENPACLYSDLYNCPLPPRENTLRVPILAGEKDLHYLSAKK